MKTRIFILILFLFFISCSSSSRIRKYISEGDNYKDSNDERELIEAVSSYRKAIDAKIEAAEKLIYVYRRLGDLYMNRRMWDMAIDSFEKAIEILPEKAIIHHNLAICYANKGSLFNKRELLQRSVKEYKLALKINKNRHNSHYGLGMILFFKLKSYSEGIEELKTAIKLKSDFHDAYQALANAYYEMDRLKEALNTLKELKRILPGRSEKIFAVDKKIERLYNELGGF